MSTESRATVRPRFRARPADAPARRTAAGWLVGLTLGALAFRGALALASGLWRDEAQLLLITGLPSWGSMLDFLHRHESHPPLFYALERVWTAIFGAGDAAALALPVLLGAALVPVTFACVDRAFGRRAGWLAATLVALSPSLATHSAMVRPYSLLPLLTLLSVFLLWRALAEDRPRALDWAAYAGAAVALPYTHNWGWLVWAAEAALAAAWLARNGGRGAARGWLYAEAAVLLAYAPWVPALAAQLRIGGAGPLGLDPVGAGLFSLLEFFRGAAAEELGPWTTTRLLGIALALGWLAAAAVGAGRALRRGPEPAGGGDARLPLARVLFLGVPVLVFAAALLLSPWTNLLFDKLFAALAPLVLASLAWWGAAARPDRARGTVAIAAAAVLAGAGVASAAHGAVRSNAREVARAVAARARPDDLVVLVPESLGSSFNRYFTRANERISYPFDGVLGPVRFDGRRERMADPAPLRALAARLERERGAGRRVWLVVNVPFMEHEPRDSSSISETVPLRGRQGRELLGRLYGPPLVRIPAAAAPGSQESLRAELFGPGMPAAAGPEARGR